MDCIIILFNQLPMLLATGRAVDAPKVVVGHGAAGICKVHRVTPLPGINQCAKVGVILILHRQVML